MEDSELIKLFFARSEKAISETSQKYKRLCEEIAHHILNNHQDAEECVNDAWLKLWNAIPPEHPESLQAYLGKIVRNTALHMYELRHAQKRGNGQFDLLLSELEDCIGDPAQESATDSMVIRGVLTRFFEHLNRENRAVFIRRYWAAQPIEVIAAETGFSQSKVESMLFRLRN